MADFDPDAYLANKGQSSPSKDAPINFDPDAYLASKDSTTQKKPEKTWYGDILGMVPGIIPRASSGLVGLADTLTRKVSGASRAEEIINEERAKRNLPPSEKVPNLGDVSLSGWKNILGSAYQEPQTVPGKVTDFALQNVIFGAKNPKELLNAPQTIRNLISGTAAGGAGELVPDDMPKIKMAAQIIGGVTPSAVETALKSPNGSVKNAAKLIRQAMEGKTPQQWAEADKLLKTSQRIGVPLTGPEAFPGGSQIQQIASNVAASPLAGGKIRTALENRPQQVETAINKQLSAIGRDVGLQEASNQAQEAAEKVISSKEELRTKRASPKYQQQRESDVDTLNLVNEIPDIQKKIKAGTAWKNDAIQQAGKWYQFSHEMGLKANDVAKKVREWAKEDAEGIREFESEGGRIDPNKAKVDNYMDRAKEGKEATFDAVKAASERQKFIDQWKADLDKKADKLAQKNIPYIQGKVDSLISKLTKQRMLAGDRDELSTYDRVIKDLAPDGKSLTLPSQLESIYKGARDKSELSLAASTAEKTEARIYKDVAKDLDKLVQDVSPATIEGRKIFKDISQGLVDPLYKGPIGKLAGKGVDSKTESSYSRMLSEFSSKTATPERIREIAKRFSQIEDKTTLPNMVRASFEEQLDSSLKRLQGRDNPSSGAKFSNALEGTPKQKAITEAMIKETAKAQGQDEAKVYKGFRNLLDVLDATGRIPGIGSQTHPRSEMQKVASESGLASAVEMAHPISISQSLAAKIRDMMNKGTYKKLAEVFTAPDSIAQMKKLAEMKSTSTAARELVSKMLESSVPVAKTASTKSVKSQDGDQQ